ncbi:Blp family class II bacteriocin [Streptococcus suis]|uniref:Blp family class II bacteriocin n=1 Tax=Streptococcus suis TaxID=1307 RepID=UPI0020052C84|nr:bacteriocin [Streptococcus suis]HEM5173998.1 Blp family class II bacteriocin [Streptococcus suis]HEM5203019.1 Blp family class II bacteriocin [Streptococcus suis]HEM5221610.1 Blp family class II bacteriocin [Streptococcus suis]HEM5223950.1 Blp family class II bacteriocin [Streptococcus suis]
MNTKTMEQFEVVDTCSLSMFSGGSAEDMANTVGSALAGGIVGFGICTASVALAPFAGACAYAGAKFGAAGYLIARYS